MIKDNSTPMARNYDEGINKTVPFYNVFYDQTLDVVSQCDFPNIEWLDGGCGTGTLEQNRIAETSISKIHGADPSEKMLEQARIKLREP